MTPSGDVPQVGQRSRQRSGFVSIAPKVSLILALLVLVIAQASGGQSASVAEHVDADVATPANKVLDEAIQIAPYQPPSPQALYVLDLNLHAGDVARVVSYVRVIDPKTRQEVLTIPARSVPNIALSPDGHSLYILDSHLTGVSRGEERLTLAVHDIQKGQLAAEINLPAQRTAYNGVPPHAEIIPSRDGARLYVLLFDVGKGLRVLTVDAKTYAITQDIATGGFCDGGWPIHAPDRLILSCAGQLAAIDLGTRQVAPFKPSASDSSPASAEILSASSAYLPGTQRLYALSAAGNDNVLTVFDLANQAQLSQVTLEAPAKAHMANVRPPTVSSDGTLLYAGFRTWNAPEQELGDILFGQGSYLDRIGVFDTSTGKLVRWVELEVPIATYTLSQDGRTLYGVSPQARSISLIDVASGRIDMIDNVGTTPVLVISGG